MMPLEDQNKIKNFAKRYVPNWSEEVFGIKKSISDFKDEELVGTH